MLDEKYIRKILRETIQNMFPPVNDNNDKHVANRSLFTTNRKVNPMINVDNISYDNEDGHQKHSSEDLSAPYIFEPKK